jgi:hypothetical protein
MGDGKRTKEHDGEQQFGHGLEIVASRGPGPWGIAFEKKRKRQFHNFDTVLSNLADVLTSYQTIEQGLHQTRVYNLRICDRVLELFRCTKLPLASFGKRLATHSEANHQEFLALRTAIPSQDVERLIAGLKARGVFDFTRSN